MVPVLWRLTQPSEGISYKQPRLKKERILCVYVGLGGRGREELTLHLKVRDGFRTTATIDLGLKEWQQFARWKWPFFAKPGLEDGVHGKRQPFSGYSKGCTQWVRCRGEVWPANGGHAKEFAKFILWASRSWEENPSMSLSFNILTASHHLTPFSSPR